MSDTIKNFSDQNTNAKLISSFTSNDHQQQNTHSHLQSQKKQHRIYEYYEEQKINHTSKVLNNNESFLNCLQFINLIQYYFNDSPTIRLSDQHTSETSAYSSASEFGIMPFRSADDCAGAQSRSSPADLSCIQTCYPCIVCSSQFSFEQTFHLHLERRSILIRFYCLKCETFKTFYNPCKLLYHIYSHKLFMLEPIYKSIKIESITLERLNLSKEKNIDLFRNLTTKGDRVNSPNLRPSFIQVNDNEQIKEFLKRLVANKFLLFKCAICSALFFDLKELRQHYFRSQQIELDKLNQENSHKSAALNRRIIYKNLKQNYLKAFNKKDFNWLNENDDSDVQSFADLLNNFSFKKLQFSTRCSTIANMNLINSNFEFFQPNKEIYKTALLVCPECGLSFNSTTQAEKFRLHLLYGCLFTMKYDCGQIKCPICPFICDSVNKFLRHWSKNHVRNQHECALCEKTGKKFIFREDSGLSESYLSPSSSGSSSESADKQKLSNSDFKPSADDDQLLNEDDLVEQSPSSISDINKHYFEKHRNQPVALKLVYRCMCKSPKSGLTHADARPDTSLGESSVNCFHSSWKSCHNHIISIIHRTLGSLNCLICNRLVPNEKYITHLNTLHSLDKISMCPICGVQEE